MGKKNNINKSEISESHFENNISHYNPKDFDLECTTVWDFPKRGDWATHRGDYRGNWAPEIPRNLIKRYSEKGETVLDPFVGSGTTLIECKLLDRRGIGIEINPEAVKLANRRLEFERLEAEEQKVIEGDARKITEYVDKESVDLICAHPPYWNIIEYTDNNQDDLSQIGNLDEFLDEMGKVARESFEVLKPNRYCAVLMGDTRNNKHVVPIGFKVMEKFQEEGFINREIIIKKQHNCKATGFWRKKSEKYNFLLLKHEYLFVFRKPKEGENQC